MSTLQKAGPTNQLFYLIKYLDKNIFDPIIVTLSPEPPYSNYDFFNDEGIKIISLGLSRLKGFFLIEKRLNNLINRFKPNIIQTLGFRADRVKVKFDIPKLITIRTSIEQAKPIPIRPVYLAKFLGVLIFRIHLINIIKTKYLVTCSKSLSKEYLQYYKKKIIYIQNGIDTEKYTLSSRKLKSRLRMNLNLASEKKVYLSLSSLIPQKNIVFLIELFKNWDYLKDSILVLLGDGIEHNKIKKSIKGYNNIKLCGYVPNVLEYLHVSDYLISASKGEGLPNAVLEAMSTGTPCILSDILPHREILNDSKLGVIYKNNNIQDVKEKITQINNMDYNSLSVACRKYTNAYFSAQKMSVEYQKLYNEVLKT